MNMAAESKVPESKTRPINCHKHALTKNQCFFK